MHSHSIDAWRYQHAFPLSMKATSGAPGSSVLLAAAMMIAEDTVFGSMSPGATLEPKKYWGASRPLTRDAFALRHRFIVRFYPLQRTEDAELPTSKGPPSSPGSDTSKRHH
jgi:hypothetical protein